MKSLTIVDALLAATANAKLAARNTSGFENCGIAVINPWQPQ